MLKERKGTLLVVIAAILYSIGGLGIKLVPWNGISINGARALIALSVVGGYLLWKKQRIYINKWVILGAIAVTGTSLFFCVANKLTTAANAIVLQFTAPVFVILMAFLIWKKIPSKLEVMTCIIVLIGVLFFFYDSLSAGGMLGNFFAILSGLSYASVFFLNKTLGEDSVVSLFWGCILSFVISIPWIVQETDFSLVPMVSLAVLGVFQMGLAFLLLVIGLRTVQPIPASLISGIEPVLNPVLVAMFYQETIGVLALIGGVIVVGGVIGYNILSAKEVNKVQKI